MGKTPIYKRGPVWWHRDPVTGRRSSTRCTDRKAALLYHAERERCAADPAYAASHTATLGKWLDKVIESKASTRAAGTLHMYRVKAGHLSRIIGVDSMLGTISPGTLDDYVTKRRQEGAKQATVYKEVVVLMQALKAARRAGEFRVDPKSLLPNDWTNAYTPKDRNLTNEEAHALLESLPEEPRAYCAFILATGARHGEAMRAEPGDLDPVRGLVQLHGTKTKRSRRQVPVLDGAAWLWAIVLEFWRAHGRGARWVRASKGIADAMKRLGLPSASPNDLRRTYASWLIHSGVEQGTVSRALGHGDTTMVARVYGQVTGSQLATLIRNQIGAGTPETHEGENHARPPGETGRRGGLKSLHDGGSPLDLADRSPLATADGRRDRVSSGTKSTQRLPLAQLALVEAALRLGLDRRAA